MSGSLADWRPPPLPPRTPLAGRYARLEPLEHAHAGDLHAAYAEDGAGEMWRYLPVGPFDSRSYLAWVETVRLLHDPLHFAVRMEDGRLGGTLSLMRITPTAGSIETGWLTFAPRLQRTREATEAVYLLMRWSFEAGYRRFEWKCDAANRPSRTAAQRLGLSYEGVFRQAAVVRGATATPHGSPRSTRSGRASAPPSRAGSIRRTSTRPDGNGSRSPSSHGRSS